MIFKEFGEIAFCGVLIPWELVLGHKKANGQLGFDLLQGLGNYLVGSTSPKWANSPMSSVDF